MSVPGREAAGECLHRCVPQLPARPARHRDGSGTRLAPPRASRGCRGMQSGHAWERGHKRRTTPTHRPVLWTSDVGPRRMHPSALGPAVHLGMHLNSRIWVHITSHVAFSPVKDSCSVADDGTVRRDRTRVCGASRGRTTDVAPPARAAPTRPAPPARAAPTRPAPPARPHRATATAPRQRQRHAHGGAAAAAAARVATSGACRHPPAPPASARPAPGPLSPAAPPPVRGHARPLGGRASSLPPPRGGSRHGPPR